MKCTSDHKKGERFSPKFGMPGWVPKYHHFEYAGEVRRPNEAIKEPFEDVFGMVSTNGVIMSGNSGLREILMLVPDGPRVSVTWWDKKAEKHEYSFHGEVDWPRLKRECFDEDEAEVVMVDPHYAVINHYRAERGKALGGNRICYVSRFHLKGVNSVTDYFWYYEDNPIPDAAIVAAIREHNKPKSAHKRGERFEGQAISLDARRVPPNHHFVYAGELSESGQTCWADMRDGDAIWGKDSEPYEILLLVPDEPAGPDWPTAARKSYYERWLPMCQAKTYEVMTAIINNTRCAMCDEAQKYGSADYVCTRQCPMRSGRDKSSAIVCGRLYTTWHNKLTFNDLPAAHLAAVALASRLAEIAGITTGEHLDKPKDKPETPDMFDWLKPRWYARHNDFGIRKYEWVWLLAHKGDKEC